VSALTSIWKFKFFIFSSISFRCILWKSILVKFSLSIFRVPLSKLPFDAIRLTVNAFKEKQYRFYQRYLCFCRTFLFLAPKLHRISFCDHFDVFPKNGCFRFARLIKVVRTCANAKFWLRFVQLFSFSLFDEYLNLEKACKNHKIMQISC